MRFGYNVREVTKMSQGWQTSPDKGPLHEGEARIHIRMDQICLRVENAMGLYETKSGKALIVKVAIGVPAAEVALS